MSKSERNCALVGIVSRKDTAARMTVRRIRKTFKDWKRSRKMNDACSFAIRAVQ